MKIRRFALGEVSGLQLGLLTSIFLSGFIGILLLPFYVYLFGAGIFWEFFGVSICMIIVWNVEAFKLMRYGRKNKSIVSIPGYLSYRFKDKHDYIRLLSSCEIIIISLVIMGLVTKEAEIVFEKLTGFDGKAIIITLLIIISVYMGIFGFKALAKTAIYKAIFMIVVVLMIEIYMYKTFGMSSLVRNMMRTNITGSVSEYMNVLYHNGKPLLVSDYVSLISMGALASGMPFLLSSFISAKNPRTVKRGKRTSYVFLVLIFIICALMGGTTRGYLYPEKITTSLSDYLKFLYDKLGSSDTLGRVISILFLILIILAFATLIEASLNVITVIFYEDILNRGKLIRVNRKHEGEALITITMVFGAVVYIISRYMKNPSVSTIIVFIGALGCSISPTVFMSLIWKRMNKAGCVAGLITGLIGVPLFKYASIFSLSGVKMSLCDILGINSIVPSMLVSFLCIVLFSLITKKPEDSIVDEFMQIRNRIS